MLNNDDGPQLTTAGRPTTTTPFTSVTDPADEPQHLLAATC